MRAVSTSCRCIDLHLHLHRITPLVPAVPIASRKKVQESLHSLNLVLDLVSPLSSSVVQAHIPC